MDVIVFFVTFIYTNLEVHDEQFFYMIGEIFLFNVFL